MALRVEKNKGQEKPLLEVTHKIQGAVVLTPDLGPSQPSAGARVEPAVCR